MAAEVLALQLCHPVVVRAQRVVRTVQQRVVAGAVDRLQLLHELLVGQPARVDSGHRGTPLVVFVGAVRVPARQEQYPSGIREGAMDLAFLHPLYEHPGPWASVYVDTSRHTESTPHERSLTAQSLHRELAEQGADEATGRAVRSAVEDLAHSPEPHGRALFARAGEVILD